MKTGSDSETTRGQGLRVHRRGPWWSLALVAAVTLIFYQFPLIKVTILQHCSRNANQSDAHNQQWENFDWDAINATEQFEFHPCFDVFQCAKLKIPLDWFNGTHANSSVSIAIAKLPAKVSVDDPRYAGPVLINPGGPGGSGVSLALSRAQDLQTVVDPSSNGVEEKFEGKYYDILGFDPRGVGFTTPQAQCMPDNPSAWSWQLRQTSEGILGSSDAALGRLWSMAHAYGAACKQQSKVDESPDIKKYMSTASVARDMLEIAERHAAWVVEKTKQVAERNSAPSRVIEARTKPKTQETVFKREDVKLTYMGFSYGTYLGTTFAAMFPDRVGRLYLDGVVDVQDYHHGLAQGSLRDTERDMKSFYTFCAFSGPELCPLAASTSSFADVERRTQKIIRSLYHNPIAINTDNGPEVFTWSDLKGIIFAGLYTPMLVFPGLAQILSAIETGHGPVLEAIGRALHSAHIYTCPAVNGTATALSNYGVAQNAILCGDGYSLQDSDIESMEEYWQLLESVSPAAGGIWAMLRLNCAAWPFRPLTSWGRDELFHGNTSHPILFASATADPVTPLHSARIMSSRYPGSVLLVQDSAGHCTLAAPSACTVNAIKAYFQSGELPDPDTVCIPPPSAWSLNSTDPGSPFYDPSLGQAVLLGEDMLGEEMRAARGLQTWATSHLSFGRSHLGQRMATLVDTAMTLGLDDDDVLKDEL